MDKTETLIDLFNNGSIPSDGNPWWTYGTLTENAGGGGFSLGGDPGGQVIFSLVGSSPGYSGLYASNDDDYYDLSNSYVHVRVDDAGPTATWSTADISLNVEPNGDSNNRCFISLGGGNVTAVRYIAGVYTWLADMPYNPTTHRWLRMRHSGTTLYWQYASDEQYLNDDWQTLYSMTAPIAVTAVTCEISCGHWDTESGSGQVKISQFNVPAKIINTIEDLNAIRNVTAGARIVGRYKLARDLDFNDDNSYANSANKSTYTTGNGWVPLGQSGNPWFGAYINGDGHTISNLMVVSGTTGINNAGLIGIADSTWIENLGLINPRINENATNNPKQAGALIAGLDPEGKSVIRKCFTKGGIVRADDDAGGLIGTLHEYTTTDLLIEDCYNDGTVVKECGSFQDGFGHGGLLGSATYIGTSTKDVIMRRCWSNGLVDPGATTNCGGLVGFDGTIGLIVSNSFWDTQTSGFATSAGGTGRTTAQSKDFSTYNGASWDIVAVVDADDYTGEVWFVKDDVDYPRLGWEWRLPTVALDSPSNAEHTSDTTPLMLFTGHSGYLEDLIYEIEIDDTDNTFGSLVIDAISNADAGFANQDNGGDTSPFNSGDQIGFTVQAGDALSDGTYYWRVRAVDSSGIMSGIFSEWSEVRRFTVGESPSEPTGPPVMIKSGGTFVAAVTKVKVSGSFKQLT